jgi:hypothetical protein
LEAAGEETGAGPLEVLPPRSGYRRRSARAAGRVLDALLDARQAATRFGPRLDRAGAGQPARRIAVYGVYGSERAPALAAAVGELRRCRHRMALALGALGEADPALAGETALERLEGGKLANLNRLASARPAAGAEWVLLLDDDVALGRGFLNRLVLLAERFGLDIAQPALSHTSHTAWPVTRRRPCLLRRTRFVEMGPAVLMRSEVFAELSPFPEAGMGWGICLHWAAVAERRGWKLGIADAVPVRHDLRPPAADYDRAAAGAAALELLRDREHLDWRRAGSVLASYRRL